MVPDKKEQQYPEKNTQLKSRKKPLTILQQPLEFFAQLILHNYFNRHFKTLENFKFGGLRNVFFLLF